MDSEFTDEQKLFAESVRRFAFAHLVFDRRFDQRPRHADATE